jgi:hypothetical protein
MSRSHPDLAEVRLLREAALANGYSLVRVRSGDKVPLSKGWQEGEAPELLLNVTEEAANTGLICKGFRVIDFDIDDAAIASEIVQLSREYLPPGPIVRRRTGSPRLALVYRAEGIPGKKVVAGRMGKVEVLGAGQQVVIHGVHPSGMALMWTKDRSPANVAVNALPSVSELQISVFLEKCSMVLAADQVTSPGNLFPRPDPQGLLRIANDNELSAGIGSGNCFDHLGPHQKRELVQACLAHVDNRQSDPRDQWLSILFAVADAEMRGCPGACQSAFKFCMPNDKRPLGLHDRLARTKAAREIHAFGCGLLRRAYNAPARPTPKTEATVRADRLSSPS